MHKSIGIKTLKQDISFFESFLDEDVLPKAETLFDDGKILLERIGNGNFEFQCQDYTSNHRPTLTIKNNRLTQYACTCGSELICEHIGAGLFFIRRNEPEKSKAQLKKRTSTLPMYDFISKIDEKELRQFLLNRMRADKETKALIYARFLLEVEGVREFDFFLDKTFPPVKTVEIKPTRKETKLFSQVVEEMSDQIIDLVGKENYVDAFLILFPLLKKSFYLKRRFKDVPQSFYMVHSKLIELIKSLQRVIEAPDLKSRITKNIVEIIAYSYVQLNTLPEKELIISQLETESGKKKVKKVIESTQFDSSNKAYKNFITALKFVCDSDYQYRDGAIPLGAIYIEINSWLQLNANFNKYLVKIAQRPELPLRFKERLLESLVDHKPYVRELTQVALSTLKENQSFPIFQWLYQQNRSAWLEIRSEVLQSLERKGRTETIIKMMIEEADVEAVFAYLKRDQKIAMYNSFLHKLLQLSKSETEELYRAWIDNYLKLHYGKTAKSFIRKNLGIVGKTDAQLKKSLDAYIKKNFSKRPGLTS